MSNLEQLAEGIRPQRSAADIVRDRYEAIQTGERDEYLPLLGPDMELHLTFGGLRDYREFRRESRKAVKGKADDTAREVALAVTSLRLASTGGYVLADGKQYWITDASGDKATLGLPLHRALFPDGRPVDNRMIVPETDGQAIHDLFSVVGDLGIISMYAKIDKWVTAGCPPQADEDADDDAEPVTDEALESTVGESSAG